MNRAMLAVVLIVFASLCQQASARIGETPEQCQVRYGKPVKVLKNNLTVYQMASIYIMVQFYEGKVDMISFRKVEQNALGIPDELSDNEIQNLLKSNGGTQEWKKREIISISKEWQTEDGTLLARFETMEKILYIATKDSLAREEAKKKAKEDKKLGGF